MTTGAEQQARRAAEEFRKVHRLGVQPLGDLVALLEQATGYDVAILAAEPNEHGLTMRDPRRNVVYIGAARSTSPMRQRSTLAHELGHVLFEDWNEEAELGTRSYQEIRADAFARHLLLPVDGVKNYLGPRAASEADLASVVQRFLVSPAIAAIALRDAGYFSPSEAKRMQQYRTRQLATRFGWRDQYTALQDGSNRLRAPQALVARAVNGYAEGVVSAQTIATLRGTSADAIRAELAEAGIQPAPPEATDLAPESLPVIDIDLDDAEDNDRHS